MQCEGLVQIQTQTSKYKKRCFWGIWGECSLRWFWGIIISVIKGNNGTVIIHFWKLLVLCTGIFMGKMMLCTRNLLSHNWRKTELGRWINTSKLVGSLTSTGYIRVHCLLLLFCVCMKSCIKKKNPRSERKTFRPLDHLLPYSVSLFPLLQAQLIGQQGKQHPRQGWPYLLQLADPGA